MEINVNPYNHEPEEPKVTIPLSQYTDMVKQIQLLTDQQEIGRLQRKIESLESKRVEVLHRMYAAEEKLKEAGIE